MPLVEPEHEDVATGARVPLATSSADRDPPAGSLEEQATRIALSATGWTPDPDKPYPTVVEAVQDLAERFEQACHDLAALEGGEPPEGSRLWRCEKELRKARELLEAAIGFNFEGPGGWYHVGLLGTVWHVTTLGNRLVAPSDGRAGYERADDAIAEAKRRAAGGGS
jgi:hypothetical protein